MKAQAIIILIAILLGALLPQSLPFLALHSDREAIGALDVCHSAAPALSSAGEMPYLGECPCKPVPPAFAVFSSIVTPVFTQSLFSTRNERPPKA